VGERDKALTSYRCYTQAKSEIGMRFNEIMKKEGLRTALKSRGEQFKE